MKKWAIRISLVVTWMVTIVYAYGLGGLAGQYAPEKVERSSALALQALAFFGGVSPCDGDDTTKCGYKDLSNRVEVSCTPFMQNPSQTSDSERRAIIFAFGQSNSANWGETRYTPRHNVINLNPHDGKCYQAQDPLLGPDGFGGSVWSIMADQLIEDGHYDSVLISSIGIGGTNIERWAPEGDLHARVKHTAALLKEKGIQPTHVVWHQGESDAHLNTPIDDYRDFFESLVKSLSDYGIDAPVYPSAATICGDIKSEALRQSMLQLHTQIDNVYPGADSDSLIDPIYRFDSCHFSQKGLEAHARLWVDAITAKSTVAANQ